MELSEQIDVRVNQSNRMREQAWAHHLPSSLLTRNLLSFLALVTGAQRLLIAAETPAPPFPFFSAEGPAPLELDPERVWKCSASSCLHAMHSLHENAAGELMERELR